MSVKREQRPPLKPGHTVDRHGRSIPLDPAKDHPMRRFISTVDRSEFEDALAASGDQRYQTFLRARYDPAYRKLGFAELCRKFNITLQEVDDLWRNHQLHRGMIAMMNEVPAILRDVAADARSRLEACPRCDGEKTVERDKGRSAPCPVCDGVGKTRVPGDARARDLVFESVGLTGKRGPLVAIQNNFGLDADLHDVLSMGQKMTALGPARETPELDIEVELESETETETGTRTGEGRSADRSEVREAHELPDDDRGNQSDDGDEDPPVKPRLN